MQHPLVLVLVAASFAQLVLATGLILLCNAKNMQLCHNLYFADDKMDGNQCLPVTRVDGIQSIWPAPGLELDIWDTPACTGTPLLKNLMCPGRADLSVGEPAPGYSLYDKKVMSFKVRWVGRSALGKIPQECEFQ